MRLLKTKFDHETTTSTLNLFTNFLDPKMNDGDDLSTHLSNFDTSFQHIISRCSQSKRPESKALKDFLSVEQVRTMCLFRSLPPSMENVVDNLSTKDGLKYADISAHLFDLISKKTSSIPPPSKAYFSSNNFGKGKGKNKGIKECNLCKKNGLPYKGHEHREYRNLKEMKESSRGRASECTRPSNSVNAVSNPHITNDHCGASHVISENAFRASTSPAPSHWILDFGCTTHMTSCKDLFSSINRQKGTVTVASGVQIPFLGRGAIHLDLLTSFDKRLSATLDNVLYVPDLKGGNLISESKLERNGYEIKSKNGQRRVLKDGREWMYAALDNMGHFVIRELSNSTLYSSYMDAHLCFGHPSQNAMEHLKERYPDLIPKKPDHFHCPSCILSKSTHVSPKS